MFWLLIFLEEEQDENINQAKLKSTNHRTVLHGIFIDIYNSNIRSILTIHFERNKTYGINVSFPEKLQLGKDGIIVNII